MMPAPSFAGNPDVPAGRFRELGHDGDRFERAGSKLIFCCNSALFAVNRGGLWMLAGVAVVIGGIDLSRQPILPPPPPRFSSRTADRAAAGARRRTFLVTVSATPAAGRHADDACSRDDWISQRLRPVAEVGEIARNSAAAAICTTSRHHASFRPPTPCSSVSSQSRTSPRPAVNAAATYRRPRYPGTRGGPYSKRIGPPRRWSGSPHRALRQQVALRRAASPPKPRTKAPLHGSLCDSRLPPGDP